jgi:hypothetical protein
MKGNAGAAGVWMVGLLAASFAEASVSIIWAENEKDYEIQVRALETRALPSPTQEGQELQLVGAEGHEGLLYEEGMPAIPVVRFYVEGEGRIAVSLESTKATSTFHLTADLVPVQPSAPKIRGAVVSFHRNKAAYARNRQYPVQSYAIEEAGRVQGLRRRLVTLYPVTYNAVTRTVSVRSSFTVRVQGSDHPEPGEIEKQKVFAFVVGPRFEQSAALQEYVQFKESQGYEVRQIVAKDGLAQPDRIRQQLQALYQDPALQLEYVLIIGDAEDVKGRASKIISGMTDHYYRVLDGEDYEADINGPDVGLGRFPAASEEHLRAMVDKSIRYSDPDLQGDWLSRISWLATDDKWQIAEASHNYVIDTFAKALGYLGVFPMDPSEGGDKLYAVSHKVTSKQTVAALHEGRAIIHYSGHGAEMGWEVPNVELEHVRALDSDALPFVVSNACITGKFTVPESFAETWVRHPKGAIAFWGSVDDTYWPEDDVMERRQYDGLFKEGKRTFHEITTFSLAEVWRHYGGAGKSKYYWETYTLFGDPSLVFHALEN